MADKLFHFIERFADGTHAAATPCGIPAPNGQLIVNGEALGATTQPHSVTCTGCGIRASAWAKESAARDAAEQQKAAESTEAEQLQAALALVEAAKAKGTL